MRDKLAQRLALAQQRFRHQMEYWNMAKQPSSGGKPPSKQTSASVSSVASGVLSGKIANPTKAQIKMLAASALSQDQTKGPPKKK